MSGDTTKNSSTGAAILLTISICFFVKPVTPVSANYSKAVEDSVDSKNLYFHVARFYGARVVPTKTILEKEIEKAADSFKINKSIFKALIHVESGGNPKAKSSVGARGIAQIMPFNAKRCGLSSPDKLWDAVSNLRCGAQILSEEVQEHGDYRKALTVYNCGRVNCPEGQQYARKVLSVSKKMA